MIGDFEFQILSVIGGLKSSAFGINIKNGVEQNFSRSVSFGALYTTLQRMEKKGFIESEVIAGTAVRGGRRKKHFRLTGLGKSKVSEKHNFYSNQESLTGGSYA